VKGVTSENLTPTATLNYTGTPNGAAANSYNSATAPANAGTYIVSATFAGNNNYNGGADDDALDIGKATPIVTATGGTFTYNGSPRAGSATVKGVNNEDLTPAATLNYIGTPNGAAANSYNSATAPANAGTYTVTATFGGNNNYNGGTDDDVLSIGKATPLVTVVPASDLIYNGQPKNASGSATGVGGVSDLLSPPVTFEYTGTNALTGLPYGPTTVAPTDYGIYSVTAKFAGNDNYLLKESNPASFNIVRQNALPVGQAFYTGANFFWTAGENSSVATLNLSATIKNSILGGGDIRTARITFAVRNSTGSGYTPIKGAENLLVGLVNAGDHTVGTSSTIVQYNIGNSTATSIDIAVIVSGNYVANNVEFDDPIMIAVPVPGGQIVGGARTSNDAGVGSPDASAGYVKGKAGLATTYTFNVKYNKSGTNPQGNVVIDIESENNWRTGLPDGQPHYYKIKSNAITVLAVDVINGTAQFTSKGNISEVINNVESSIEGNISIQIDVTDFCVEGDKIAITVHKAKGGGIWFSNSWDGVKSSQKLIVPGSGNISVKPCTTTNSAITQLGGVEKNVVQEKVVATKFNMKAFPNPTTNQFNIQLESDNVKERINLSVFDLSGRTVELLWNINVGQTLQIGSKYRPGMYIVEMIQGNNRKQLKLLKQPD
jgi:hypothetical protein